MRMSICLLIAALAQSGTSADATLSAYVNAIGGQDAIGRIRARVTRGTFDNGRGLVESFVKYELPPDKVATIIGRSDVADARGSARGYDGTQGWDKNFIGTGLRSVTGPELGELRQSVDLFPPLGRAATCLALPSPDDLLVLGCDAPQSSERWYFSRETNLLTREESRRKSDGRLVTTYFEDYRPVDGVREPFRVRFVTPGATVVYQADRVSHSEAIDQRVFARPPR